MTWTWLANELHSTHPREFLNRESAGGTINNEEDNDDMKGWTRVRYRSKEYFTCFIFSLARL